MRQLGKQCPPKLQYSFSFAKGQHSLSFNILSCCVIAILIHSLHRKLLFGFSCLYLFSLITDLCGLNSKQQPFYNSYKITGSWLLAYLKFTWLQREGYIPVEAHVMATPVLVDLNNDQKSQELVIPVSYFFDEEDYRFVQLNTVLSHFYS